MIQAPPVWQEYHAHRAPIAVQIPSLHRNCLAGVVWNELESGGVEHKMSTVAHRGCTTLAAGWAERAVRAGVRLLQRDTALVLDEPPVKSLQ